MRLRRNPLHPPGKPHQLRTAHLPNIRVPMLFVQGSRDPFGTPAELGPVLDALYSLYEYHLQAITFGVGLKSPHPYQSQPWDWLVITRPVAYGNGKPLFIDLAQALELNLLATTAFASGHILRLYVPKGRGNS